MSIKLETKKEGNRTIIDVSGLILPNKEFLAVKTDKWKIEEVKS